MDAIKSPLAGSVFYTMDSPGRWAKKAVAHVPQIERSGDKIEVSTGHPMDGHVHYIVKHVVLDEKFRRDVFVKAGAAPGSAWGTASLVKPMASAVLASEIRSAK